MRNSIKDCFSEIKDVKGRRSIRDRSEEVNFLPNRMKLTSNEDRSNSEPPRSYGVYLQPTSSRLKPIREKKTVEGSSDEDGELSKSNSQLNESDLDLEIPDSASASVSQTPTPTPLAASNARRINSETNLNDSKRRLSGFMGNRSKRFCASTSELSFSSHLDTQKSLFSAKNNALSRQSFNSSLYGSNMSLSSTNSRLFMANSPFYSGKTMFGGASAYPKRDINQHKILRNPVQMRPSSSLSNSSNTSVKSDIMMPESNAAKRILEVMNQFSGPLKEARSMGNNINSIIKIPSMVQNQQRYGEEELNLDRSIALSTPSIPYGRPLPGAQSRRRPESPLYNSSINKPLQIPTMSQLLQMKRLQNNTEKVREIASRSDSFLNRNHEYKLPSAGDETQSPSSGSSLKMKSNITKNLLRNDKSSVNDQLPALPVNLPNIQLPQLKSIPKFDIQVSKIVTPPAKSTSSPIVSTPPVQFNFKNSQTTLAKQGLNTLKIAKSDFILSKPTPACDETFDMSSLTYRGEKFILSKPLLISENDFDNHNEIVAKSINNASSPDSDSLFKNLVAKQKSASWNCDSCMSANDNEKTKCLCCDAAKPGSQSDSRKSFVSNSNAPAADDLFKNLAAQQKKTQWECDSCMTKNDSIKDKCACCETPKPGSKPSTTATLAPASTFTFGMPACQTIPKTDDLFKNLAAQQKKTQWDCDSCMTKNDVGKDKCACCETPKPGSKPTSTPALAPASSFTFGMPAASQSAPPSDDMFKNLAAQQKKTQWECEACMSKNDISKDKCACCETPKPGSKSNVSNTSSLNFSFVKPLASNDEGFKKLVQKQSANWECTACLTFNEPSKTKCLCCEQAKPGSELAAPQFSFGSKMSSSVALPALSEVKFSFGMPAVQTDIKKDETIVEEKKDEVDKPKPNLFFGATNNLFNAVDTTKLPEVSATTTAPTFTFKAPSSMPAASASFTLESPKNNDLKKDEEKSVKPSLFAFGAPAVKSPEPEKKITFGDLKAAEPVKTLPEAAKLVEEEPKKSDFGGFKFGEQPKDTAVPTFGSSLNKNGGFSFGGFGSKPAETVAEPIKAVTATPPSASGGFSFGASSNSNSFGNLSATATTAQVSATNTFSFGGAQKTENATPTFGSFGSSTMTTKSSFEMNSTNSAPVFGQPTASSAFSFSAKKEEPNHAPSSVFSFGAKPEQPASAPMLFGNNQANQVSAPTPMFGANAIPSFGSTPSTNNNNESGFGSKMPSFGSATQPQKRAFDFSSATPEMPQTKKFDFGAPQQQQQQLNANATPFQFNAQGNENKPAFNFGAMASPSPSFNFSNPAANIPQTPSSAQVMQFGSGAATPSIGIPGITSFSAQGTVSSAAANQRKILRASRRTMQRR